MIKLNIDFNKKVGRIKPMHGVGQPPLVGIDTSYFRYLTEANIPYSRLHDVGGWFGGSLFVDIPNIFRDFDKDAAAEESYDFAFTDILIKGLIENECEPYFRLGVTIENFRLIKAYKIFPPKDFEKWAIICEHIVRHYNEGWANGFHYNIKYWEIWNEPDDDINAERSSMWRGTPEQYFELYAVTAKHLRKCFGDTIKIGGYACTGLNGGAIAASKLGGFPPEDVPFIFWNDDGEVNTDREQTEAERDCERILRHRHRFFDMFINKVTAENLPLDFFSYHSYTKLKDAFIIQRYIEKRLEAAGLGGTEIHLNEWNNCVEGWNIPKGTNCRGTSIASALCAAFMCAMQDTKMALMCYYDARIGIGFLGGLFNPLTKEPFCTYYAIKAFGKLYKLGNEAALTGKCKDVYALAATDDVNYGMLVSNIGEDEEVTTNLPEDMNVYLIDENNLMVKADMSPGRFLLKRNQVLYIEK